MRLLLIAVTAVLIVVSIVVLGGFAVQERWIPGAQEVLNEGSHHSYELPNRCSEMRSHLRRCPM